MSPAQTTCSSCQHEFAKHYTAYGGMMGCGHGTLSYVLTFSYEGRRQVTLRCPCDGFAEIVKRDQIGHPVQQ